MAADVIPFPKHRVTRPYRYGVTVEQCRRLESAAIAAGEWEQAAFFMRAALVVAHGGAVDEAANDNIIPLRRA